MEAPRSASAAPGHSAMEHTNFGDIPPEILIGILRHLPILSLKDARLACKQWADVGARCLFSRIYFAPRYEVMQVFTNITQNTDFASNVDTIIYDARLFWRYMENPKVYRAAQRRGFPEDFPDEDTTGLEEDGNGVRVDSPSEAAYLESATRYSNLLREQTGILDAQEDLQVLRTALKRLPNLRHISVLDWFDDVPVHLHFIRNADEFRWYRDWSATLCQETACHFNKMRGILPKMRDLNSLTLAIPCTPDDSYDVFRGARWSHLTILDLGKGYWISDKFEEVVKAHADTLRELRLRDLILEYGDSWKEVATRFGQSLQLHMVALSSLANLRINTGINTYPFLNKEDIQSTARLLMQRTPDHLLGLKVGSGWAIAWHKQKFKPAYDFDRVLENISD
ncbi:MAG: hypothetical protein LQ352_005661 [Teloschistes flavicans]|nr:MAG: hypothetical protein LQ352_005661 [Teloschistes flavicans]